MIKETRLLTERDTDIVNSYLERNHIETTFLIGNVKDFGLTNDPTKRRCGDYFGYFEDDILRGILPFYNLGSCIPHFESLSSVHHFVDIMKKRDFRYLLGMEAVVDPILRELKKYRSIADYSNDSYYVNTDFNFYKAEGLVIKDSNAVSLEEAGEFLAEARNLGFGENLSREEAVKVYEGRGPGEDILFGIKDGKLASIALVQTTTSRINQIGGVYTREEYRGKGYCKAVVSELCKRILSRGKAPTLIVTKDNTPAVKAYGALGFRHYADYLIITFSTGRE